MPDTDRNTPDRNTLDGNTPDGSTPDRNASDPNAAAGAGSGSGPGPDRTAGRARVGPRTRWRRWRRSRPFWGGLATVAAGTEICLIPLAPVKVMLHQGIAGLPSVLLALIMIVMGLSAWFAPHYRGLAGIVTVLLAAAALVMSNLGGFFAGTLLGIVGGSMIFAWRPLPSRAEGDPAGERPDAPGLSPGPGPATTAAP